MPTKVTTAADRGHETVSGRQNPKWVLPPHTH